MSDKSKRGPFDQVNCPLKTKDGTNTLIPTRFRGPFGVSRNKQYSDLGGHVTITPDYEGLFGTRWADKPTQLSGVTIYLLRDRDLKRLPTINSSSTSQRHRSDSETIILYDDNINNASLNPDSLRKLAFRRTNTDSSGQYIFSQIPPGTYWVILIGTSRHTNDLVKVQVQTGTSHMLDLAVDQRHMGELKGIVEVSGKRLANIKVELLWSTPGIYLLIVNMPGKNFKKLTKTNSNGEFSIVAPLGKLILSVPLLELNEPVYVHENKTTHVTVRFSNYERFVKHLATKLGIVPDWGDILHKIHLSIDSSEAVMTLLEAFHLLKQGSLIVRVGGVIGLVGSLVILPIMLAKDLSKSLNEGVRQTGLAGVVDGTIAWAFDDPLPKRELHPLSVQTAEFQNNIEKAYKQSVKGTQLRLDRIVTKSKQSKKSHQIILKALGNGHREGLANVMLRQIENRLSGISLINWQGFWESQPKVLQ